MATPGGDHGHIENGGINIHVDEHRYKAGRATDHSKRKTSRLTFGHRREEYEPALKDFEGIPRMNIAILITGSRGDVQPFIALGNTLQKEPYNHRVRICTHGNFRDFVKDNDLEFFSIGGDPEQLMDYMVKNPGIMPSFDSMKEGDVGKRKAELEEMLLGSWHACTEAIDSYDLSKRKPSLDKQNFDLLDLPPPFVADAIIANPPTYGAVHVAERLSVPLHMMFTMPWTPTEAFPHPMANMDYSKEDQPIANFLSYGRMELLTWTGLADIFNRFRLRTLLLDAVDPTWGYSIFDRLKVPFTYCWSQALIPKPEDWGDHIGISGFMMLSLGSDYTPEDELQKFLDAGDKPIYIGFGSITLDEPEKFAKTILEAVEKAGVRALISKGWLWENIDIEVPDNVHLLGNIPHDWLFKRVSAVVHHGGAGTTATGIALGKPTVIVPFFGDQFFWAGMVSRAGAGPQAVPAKEMTSDQLAENIKKALEPEMAEKAQELGGKMKEETGPKTAAEQFQSTDQLKSVGCFLLPDRIAVWRIRNTNVQLSTLAAAILVSKSEIKPDALKLIRHKRWLVSEGAKTPIVGMLSAITETMGAVAIDSVDFKRRLQGKGYAANQDKAIADGFSKEDDADPRQIKMMQERLLLPSGKVAGHIGLDIITFPVTFFYNAANGFHNAPLTLLNDPTVRMHDEIYNLRTGLMVSGKEILFGVYDGFTGLVTHPYKAAKDGRNRKGGVAVGAAKGVARGLGGFVFRIGAAAFGIPGYCFKGCEQQAYRWAEINDDLVKEEDVESFKRDIQNSKDATPFKQLLRQHAYGTGAMKKVMERRVWQGFRDIIELQKKPAEYQDVEKMVMQRWKGLKRVPRS